MGGERNNCNFDGNSASNCAILFAVVHLRSLDQLHKFILFLLRCDDNDVSGMMMKMREIVRALSVIVILLENCSVLLLSAAVSHFNLELVPHFHLCISDLFRLWTSFSFIRIKKGDHILHVKCKITDRSK